MRTIGLIGGMSWESSAEYYRMLNLAVRDRLGGHHSPPLLMASLDFATVRALQQREAWDEAGALLAGAAQGLVAAGADVLVLCTNLMHKVAPAIEEAARVPFLHIADAVGAQIRELGVETVGVLATRWVMEEPFYRERLAERFGVRTVVPQAADRAMVDRVIFDELTQNQVRDESRAAYQEVIGRLADAGAEAIVLACTEIELLIKPADCPLPVVDSTAAHVAAALAFAMAE